MLRAGPGEVLSWHRHLAAASVARVGERRPRPLERNSAFVAHGVLRSSRARRHCGRTGFGLSHVGERPTVAGDSGRYKIDRGVYSPAGAPCIRADERLCRLTPKRAVIDPRTGCIRGGSDAELGAARRDLLRVVAGDSRVGGRLADVTHADRSVGADPPVGTRQELRPPVVLAGILADPGVRACTCRAGGRCSSRARRPWPRSAPNTPSDCGRTRICECTPAP